MPVYFKRYNIWYPIYKPQCLHNWHYGLLTIYTSFGDSKYKHVHIIHVLGTGNEEVMNQVAMPILDDAVCQSHWQDFIPNTEVCAGYENGGKDFCSVS